MLTYFTQPLWDYTIAELRTIESYLDKFNVDVDGNIVEVITYAGDGLTARDFVSIRMLLARK